VECPYTALPTAPLPPPLTKAPNPLFLPPFMLGYLIELAYPYPPRPVPAGVFKMLVFAPYPLSTLSALLTWTKL